MAVSNWAEIAIEGSVKEGPSATRRLCFDDLELCGFRPTAIGNEKPGKDVCSVLDIPKLMYEGDKRPRV